MVVGLWVIRLSESRSKPSSKNTRNPSGLLHIDSPDGYLDELFALMNDGEHEDDGDDDEPEITEEQIYGSQEFYANINRLSPSGEGDDGDDGPAVGSDDGIEGQLKGYEDDQQDEGEGEGEGENGGGNDGAPKRKRKIVKEGKGRKVRARLDHEVSFISLNCSKLLTSQDRVRLASSKQRFQGN